LKGFGKMEIVLAIVVVGAVIFFGALITAGNERQRKAIDELREQTVLWAIQDLRIKRERLARQVEVGDPLGWLNKVAAKACGYHMNLKVEQAFDQPPALSCISGDGEGKVLFTPLSPADIRKMKQDRHSRLSRYAERNPFASISRRCLAYELSALNSGVLFDLELPLAWKATTGSHVEQMERIWMYWLAS
jgi:hypothetical protein